jgi:hypothetical protein
MELRDKRLAVLLGHAHEGPTHDDELDLHTSAPCSAKRGGMADLVDVVPERT